MQPPGRWKILVVDEHSQRLINSVLKQFDILEENVTRASPAAPPRARVGWLNIAAYMLSVASCSSCNSSLARTMLLSMHCDAWPRDHGHAFSLQ